jgi:hypothetical protein
MIIPDAEFRLLIAQVVTETLDRLEAERVKLSDTLAYPKTNATAFFDGGVAAR